MNLPRLLALPDADPRWLVVGLVAAGAWLGFMVAWFVLRRGDR